MSKLSKADVLKLARLSRLKLSEEEIDSFSTELSEILDYVDTLKGVDTKGLKPTYQVTGLVNVMRDDTLKSYQAKPGELLKNAPSTSGGQFKVKRVLG